MNYYDDAKHIFIQATRQILLSSISIQHFKHSLNTGRVGIGSTEPMSRFR